MIDRALTTTILVSILSPKFHKKAGEFVRIFSSFDFDNIIILDQGKIVEIGSHETLIQQKGTYAEMYDNQHITSINPI